MINGNHKPKKDQTMPSYVVAYAEDMVSLLVLSAQSTTKDYMKAEGDIPQIYIYIYI